MQLHEFWVYLDRLVETCPVVIDRPKGTRHPHYPDIVYNDGLMRATLFSRSI